jgi:hypothetical protein
MPPLANMNKVVSTLEKTFVILDEQSFKLETLRQATHDPVARRAYRRTQKAVEKAIVYIKDELNKLN